MKKYIGKLQAAQNRDQGPDMRVDKGAAGRFIKHALAGNKEMQDGNSNESNQ